MHFGLFSNGRRPGRTLGQAWDLDIDEIAVADSLGFKEAWISEHYMPAEFVICKAAARTSTIKLGTGVRLLPYAHPFHIATEVNAVDQLTGGRYLFGVGSGFWKDQLRARGVDPDKIHDMLKTSLAVITRLLNGETPFDHESPYWKGTAMALQIPSVQKPHPPITVAVNNSPETARLAGRNGFGVITADFIPALRIKLFGDAMVEARKASGRTSSRKELRACRVVYVGDSDTKARDDMRETFSKRIAWDIENAPHHQTDRIPPGGTLQDITFDYLADTNNIIVGGVETVTKQLRAFYEETGGFGVLNVHAGRDYATPDKLAKSMTLLMQQVAPKLRDCEPD
jgi:alkanesulfonate monooxygenase SsuD/methylene tetrahydromethanopterin reductase-like flavin-dependent oxidoreductase (luciferase family)